MVEATGVELSLQHLDINSKNLFGLADIPTNLPTLYDLSLPMP